MCYLSFNTVLVRFINTLNKETSYKSKDDDPMLKGVFTLTRMQDLIWSIFYTIREETTRWTFGEEINSYFMG